MLICDKAKVGVCEKCFHSIPHESSVAYYNDREDVPVGCEEMTIWCGEVKEKATCIEVEEV